MNGGAAQDSGARRILADVRAVLDPNGKGEMSRAQRELFETVATWSAQFDMDRNNPIVTVVDHTGHYWRNWLLLILHTGAFRPSKIARILRAVDPSRPISHRILTLNLRVLERDGIIERKVVNSSVKNVEYSLTELGNQLTERVMAVMKLIGDNAQIIADARARFDAGEAAERLLDR